MSFVKNRIDCVPLTEQRHSIHRVAQIFQAFNFIGLQTDIKITNKDSSNIFVNSVDCYI